MNSTNFGSTFAPYTPPPDDPLHMHTPATASGSGPASTARAAHTRPWFPANAETSSYQSGGLPTLGTAYGGGGSIAVGLGGANETETPANQWETRYGMRVDVLAAFAYVLGPLSALFCLILETHNDYVRFHAYQSALVTTPLALLRIFASLVRFPSFLKTMITVWIVVSQAFLAFRAYIDAVQNNLTRFYVPYIGPLAEQWVSEE